VIQSSEDKNGGGRRRTCRGRFVTVGFFSGQMAIYYYIGTHDHYTTVFVRAFCARRVRYCRRRHVPMYVHRVRVSVTDYNNIYV